MKNIRKTLLLLVVSLVILSCKKFLEVGSPKDKISPGQVFENDQIATSAITGIYSKMATSGFASGDNRSVTVLAGLSADELRSYTSSLDGFYQNQIATSSSQISGIWTDAYASIYAANAVLEGLSSATSVTENTARQLRGEAKFIRAFSCFYLVNLFGEVPLNLSTDYRVNEIAVRASIEAVNSQIIADLTDAENLLADNYVTTERIRPNKYAASALFARVYLYNRHWELAAKKATEVIAQKNRYSLPTDLAQVFLKNSAETIFQLMPTVQGGNGNTREGNLFILNATPASVSLKPELLTAFDDGDKRKTSWIKEYSNATGKYYYPFKYKVRTGTDVSEYSMVIRLAEMHLIRAEAEANLGQADSALEDINLIRKRAGLSTPLAGLDPQQCLIEVQKQRRLELFTEWGPRWFDLKRTALATSTLSPIKGATWQNTDVLYPIPDNEINRNPNCKQNLGY